MNLQGTYPYLGLKTRKQLSEQVSDCTKLTNTCKSSQ